MQDTSIANKVIARWQAGVPVRILVDPRANPTYAGNEQILNQFKMRAFRCGSSTAAASSTGR